MYYPWRVLLMNEVINSIKYVDIEPEIAANANIVLKKRYLKKDEKGNIIETPKEMFQRVASNIAQAELIYNKNTNIEVIANSFFEIMATFKFLPNSPTLMNAGKELQQLSACFVLPIEDSLDKIFEAVKYTALIHKSGGGTGFSFSRLRPKEDVVKSTKGVSSGPVSFMTVFDSATETIKQGGTRRGANMGILRVDHPDIMEFVHAKKDHNKLNNFNLSVAITDKFMEAYFNNKTYELINPRTKQITGTLNAKDVFNEMVKLAWEGGDPGVIFIDKINQKNPTPEFEIESTNPCGEQPLLPYESCNLGSLNLKKFIKDKKILWDDLKNTINIAVRFLDNVIDMNRYPIDIIDKVTKENRKIGLGVMGWADMLALLEIPYNSEEAISLAEKIMSFIQNESKVASSKLAEERGNFPNFDKSIYKLQGYKNMRNATTTTIAPTGTISIIANCSSGIEPYFALAFYRNVLDNDKLVEINEIFKGVAEKEGFYDNNFLEEVATKGSIAHIKNIPDKWKRIFIVSHEIKPDWHVKMQATFQKYTDNAVSKTVNFPNSATIEDIRKVYLLSYKLECKGITIYRDGSRSEQVINIGTDIKTRETVEIPTFKPKPRPKVLVGRTIEMVTGCGKLYVTINLDETGKPFEVFTSIGKAGGCAQSQCEAIGRLISIILRSGGQPETVIKQLKGISCHMKYGFGPHQVLSCADAVAKAIEITISEPVDIKTPVKSTVTIDKLIDEIEEKKEDKKVHNGACPECGAPITYIEGCDVCFSCGYSHCN
jgi:ribonucleoside-diphosphate reductase alpha chain